MALKTTPTTDLRTIDTDLQVKYTRRRIYGSWTHVSTTVASTTYNQAWEYVRTATKNYRYVGLTYDAARSLADVLEVYYRRSTHVSEWDEWNGRFVTVDGGTFSMADVAVQHDEGDAYSVVVSVNEQDTRMMLAISSDAFDVVFATENLRSYDTGNVPTAS